MKSGSIVRLLLLYALLVCSCSSINRVDKHSRVNFVNTLNNEIQAVVWVYAKCGTTPEHMNFQTISVNEGIIVYCDNGNFMKLIDNSIQLNGRLIAVTKEGYVLDEGFLLKGSIMSYK